MKNALTTALVLAALLAGCSKPEEPVADRKPEGREETRGIRNTEAIGYSGDAIADKLDSALDANDARNRELERAIEQ